MTNPFSAKAGIKITIKPVEDNKPEKVKVNPFAAKTPAKKSNPFAARAKDNGNPFVAKKVKTDVKPKNDTPNPFAERAKSNSAERLAQLDTMIAEAEKRYEDSLEKAIKGGVNRAQIKKLFDISDRHMNALLRLGQQRRLHTEGRNHKGATSWTKNRKRGATQKKANSSTLKSTSQVANPSKPKKSPQQAAAPKKKKAATPTAGGRARRTRRRH